jgi:hypothetical protein
MSVKSKKKPPTGLPKARWRLIYLVTAYRYTRMGMTEDEVAAAMGTNKMTLWRWGQRIPELNEAMELARKEIKDKDAFRDWVYSRMAPPLKALWDQIGVIEEGGGRNPIVEIERILQDAGVRVRQELFLHALCMLDFSPSKALAKINITKRELDRWLNTDPGFKDLIEEIQWHKGNFFEEQLTKLVAEKNPAAVIFANRTFNKDRGYLTQTRTQVEVSGGVAVGVFDLSVLLPYLTEPCKLELLDAIRKKEQADMERQRLLGSPILMMNQVIASSLPDEKPAEA